MQEGVPITDTPSCFFLWFELPLEYKHISINYKIDCLDFAYYRIICIFAFGIRRIMPS